MSSNDPRAEILGIIRRVNDATYTETGHDLLVFNRHRSEWLVVWRAMLPAPV